MRVSSQFERSYGKSSLRVTDRLRVQSRYRSLELSGSVDKGETSFGKRLRI
jgi:hypothetical protein